MPSTRVPCPTLAGWCAWLLVVLTGIPCSGVAGDPASAARGAALASQLGCAQCHADLPSNAAFRESTPDLGSAGLRYQAGWIFEFLRQPTRVRQHLGAARMPTFPLTEPEALALTLYLETQRHVQPGWPALPPAIRALESEAPRPVSRDQFHAELGRGLACLACHDYAGQGAHHAVELTHVSARVHREWVLQYLVAPGMFGVSPVVMPPQFYLLGEERREFREIQPGAAARIQALTDHLFTLNEARRAGQDARLDEARKRHPGLTVAQGETLFRALNCTACHRHPTMPRPGTGSAPALATAGHRLQPGWLVDYLRRPRPVRLSGHPAGSGSRMPDFRLEAGEAGDLAAFLLAQTNAAAPLPTQPAAPSPRSAFAWRKAESLFLDQLSCLGCHPFNGAGGRLGPDLALARERLRPEYLFAVMQRPHTVAPQAGMPPAPMPEANARLIADWLLQQPASPRDAAYLSPLEHSLPGPLPPDAVTTNAPLARAARNYARHCAACHGAGGRGDGFNARFLPVAPTRHAEPAALRLRPDDTLFDGIHGGGRILNRSPLMPAWGELLSREEIRELVRYLRQLCRCEGPDWTRDGSP